MGDRGNIVVRHRADGEEDIWLYSHYLGSELKDILQKVLSFRTRWDDAPYLTRIIFSAMTQNADSSLGFGISNHMLDNEHGILIVDVPKQKVVRMEEKDLVALQLPTILDYRVSRSFEDYALTGFKKPVDKRRLPVRRRYLYSLASGDSRDRKSYGRRKDD